MKFYALIKSHLIFNYPLPLISFQPNVICTYVDSFSGSFFQKSNTLKLTLIFSELTIDKTPLNYPEGRSVSYSVERVLMIPAIVPQVKEIGS